MSRLILALSAPWRIVQVWLWQREVDREWARYARSQAAKEMAE